MCVCMCVCAGEKESIFELEQVFVLECVCVCRCVWLSPYMCLCECTRKLEGEIHCIQGDRYLFFFSFFLRVGGGISDHRRPTFHKFIFSHKRNGHFCVIPCHITHCPLVITNAEREMESKKEEQAFFLEADVSCNL